MKYRALSATGDYQFGRSGIFLTDSVEAVAQAILTRLQLWAGEWFLDDREGTDYQGKILGYGTQGTRDQEIKTRILETPGVVELIAYSSSITDRQMKVAAEVRTQYGTTTITTTVGT